MKSLTKPLAKNNKTVTTQAKKSFTKPSEANHRTVGLKARTYRKATPSTIGENQPSRKEIARNGVDSDKENNQMASNKSKQLMIDKVQIKDYLSNIIKKVDECQKETGLVKKYCTMGLDFKEPKNINILDELKDDEPAVGLTSMRSEGGLLKIKRKRSTLRIFNPYA